MGLFRIFEGMPVPEGKMLISIHAPHGGSDRFYHCTAAGSQDFNPRSPWGERPNDVKVAVFVRVFQFTLPVGGATSAVPVLFRPHRISIHAPRGGSDTRHRGGNHPPGHFNPRSPWGERRAFANNCSRNRPFQSTLPVGGATTRDSWPHMRCRISIHAPRGGSDAATPEE